MKLGIKHKKGALSPHSVAAPKEHFPSFNINDKLVDEWLKSHKVGLGDELTATVCLRVSNMRADEYGKAVGFDVLEIKDEKVTKGGKGKKLTLGSNTSDNDGDES